MLSDWWLELQMIHKFSHSRRRPLGPSPGWKLSHLRHYAKQVLRHFQVAEGPSRTFFVIVKTDGSFAALLTGDQSGQKVQKLSYLQWIWGGLSVNTQPCHKYLWIWELWTPIQEWGRKQYPNMVWEVLLENGCPGQERFRLHILPREFPW